MKIAVIGGGISGLGSGVILSPHHEVHLFEAENRLGGHAHTVDVQEAGSSVPVDTGFLVFNELNYPNLTAFFKYLDVKIANSDMSLSIRTATSDLEWAGTNLNSIFGQRKNLIRPSFFKMLREILRFHREAESNLILSRQHGWTLGDLFQKRDYSPAFREHYLIPIGAAIWSTSEKGILDYPADTFIAFFLNHKLLQVNDRPVWKTVAGGSREYVKKARTLIANVHLNHEVLAVQRNENGVIVKTATSEAHFDKVIFATHAPITLKLLQDPCDIEKNILSSFALEPNRAVLHRDSSAMPITKRCWSAWNVISGSGGQVALTYHLNRLQPLQSSAEYFLTLNPSSTMKETIGTYNYNHPRFTRQAIRAQGEIPNIQGVNNTFFSGAWTRYGFHEDGLLSAINVARLLGSETPWKLL